MPEIIPDPLHRHALIEKMLSCGVAQCVRAPASVYDAEFAQAVPDDFPQGGSTKRLDRSGKREEQGALRTRGTDLEDVAKNGLANAS